MIMMIIMIMIKTKKKILNKSNNILNNTVKINT